MANYYDNFSTLVFNKAKDHRTKEVLGNDAIKKDVEYVGVAHLHKICWFNGSVREASVDLYVTPCGQTDVEAKINNVTDHKTIMEELSLWKRFENIKQKACHENGTFRDDFDVQKERELFYGFERKNNSWSGASATLNSWVKGAVDAVRQADMISLVPHQLWMKMEAELELLIPWDGKPWSLGPDVSRRRLSAKGEKKELAQMRRLVLRSGIGAKLYKLNLQGKDLASGGLSAVRIFATVLQEEVVDKVEGPHPRCSHLEELNLFNNSLNDEHMRILAPVIRKCRELKELSLGWNRIGDEGCADLSQSLPSKLEHLSLDDNVIGDRGCSSLAENLPSKLQQLSLSENRIGDEGCVALSRYLPNELKELRLDCNKISDEGCIALSKNLPRSLKAIQLSRNKIGSNGCEAVLLLLQSKENFLSVVSLSDNPGFDRNADQRRFNKATHEKVAYLKLVSKDDDEKKSDDIKIIETSKIL